MSRRRPEALPPPVDALFPTGDARTQIDALLTRELAAATARVLAGPVMPTIDRS